MTEGGPRYLGLNLKPGGGSEDAETFTSRLYSWDITFSPLHDRPPSSSGFAA
jgi:hypothetical protein